MEYVEMTSVNNWSVVRTTNTCTSDSSQYNVRLVNSGEVSL